MSNKKNKRSNRAPGRNHFSFYFFYTIFLIFFRPLFKFKLTKKVKTIEKPAIVLCNHGSFTDFFYAGKVLHRYNPRFITARLYFYNKTLASILRSVGCFPKSMFASDIENAKNCVKVLGEGNVLVMMPEARLSTVGKFEDIQDSTLKFIRKMNINVYTLKLGGDYFAYPKWSKGIRFRAFIEAELDILFKAGEAMQLPQEAFDAKVIEALDYNDFEWLKKHPEVKYKCKTLASGLENILNLCPHCGKTLTIKTNKRRVYCSECGFEVEMNDRYAFNPNPYFENFQQWYDYQAEQMKKSILEGDFKLESKVKLMHASKDGKTQIRYSGDGICVLNKDGLTYSGTEDGEQVERFFPLDKIYRLLFGAGVDFEIYEGTEIYYFVPEDLRSCVMWYTASILLKEVYNS